MYVLLFRLTYHVLKKLRGAFGSLKSGIPGEGDAIKYAIGDAEDKSGILLKVVSIFDVTLDINVLLCVIQPLEKKRLSPLHYLEVMHRAHPYLSPYQAFELKGETVYIPATGVIRGISYHHDCVSSRCHDNYTCPPVSKCDFITKPVIIVRNYFNWAASLRPDERPWN